MATSRKGLGILAYPPLRESSGRVRYGRYRLRVAASAYFFGVVFDFAINKRCTRHQESQSQKGFALNCATNWQDACPVVAYALMLITGISLIVLAVSLWHFVKNKMARKDSK
jgi:hypothetical protein